MLTVVIVEDDGRDADALGSEIRRQWPDTAIRVIASEYSFLLAYEDLMKIPPHFVIIDYGLSWCEPGQEATRFENPGYSGDAGLRLVKRLRADHRASTIEIVVGSHTDFGNLPSGVGVTKTKDKAPTTIVAAMRSRISAEPLLRATLSQSKGMTGRLKNKIFISYAREDSTWAEKLHSLLSFADLFLVLTCFTDRDLDQGIWEEQIGRHLSTSGVVIFLVSNSFFRSTYIADKELRPILVAHQNGELVTVSWVAVGPSVYKFRTISKFTCLNNPDAPLSELTDENKLERTISDIVNKIVGQIQIGNAQGA
jgi:hypothetical protein